MSRTNSMLSSFRGLAEWVLLFAVLLRGLIPVGYMPNPNPADGRGLLTICYGTGVSAADRADSDAAAVDTRHEGLCVFAMLGGLLPLLALAALILWLPHRLVRFRRVTAFGIVGPCTFMLLGARAPPQTA